MKRIPKRFKVFAHVIDVTLVNADKWHHTDCSAYFSPDFDRIYVRRQGNTALEMHSFWHEVSHAIMHFLNRDALYADEVLIDNMGAVLAQIMDTAE